MKSSATAGLALMLAVGCGRQPRYDPVQFARPPDPATPAGGFREAWHVPVYIAHPETVGLAHGQLVIRNDDTFLVDARTGVIGATLTDTPSPGLAPGPAVLVDDMRGSAAYDIATGRLRWRLPRYGEEGFTQKRLVPAMGVDHGLNLEDSSRDEEFGHFYPLESEFAAVRMAIDFRTVQPNVLVVDVTIDALDPMTGRSRWKRTFTRPEERWSANRTAFPVAFADTSRLYLWAPETSGTLTAYDVADGKKLWSDALMTQACDRCLRRSADSLVVEHSAVDLTSGRIFSVQREPMGREAPQWQIERQISADPDRDLRLTDTLLLSEEGVVWKRHFDQRCYMALLLGNNVTIIAEGAPVIQLLDVMTGDTVQLLRLGETPLDPPGPWRDNGPGERMADPARIPMVRFGTIGDGESVFVVYWDGALTGWISRPSEGSGAE